jgi:hypothetical protein
MNENKINLGLPLQLLNKKSFGYLAFTTDKASLEH